MSGLNIHKTGNKMFFRMGIRPVSGHNLNLIMPILMAAVFFFIFAVQCGPVCEAAGISGFPAQNEPASVTAGHFSLSPMRAQGGFDVDSNSELVQYTGNASNVVIPDGIKSIGVWAFRYNEMTSVVIPNTVKYIRNGAFSHCWKLTSLKIPRGVLTIGDGAFEYCSALKSVEISNTVTTIGNNAFWFCDTMDNISGRVVKCERTIKISIPDSVEYIGKDAFSPNVSLIVGRNSFAEEYCYTYGLKCTYR